MNIKQNKNNQGKGEQGNGVKDKRHNMNALEMLLSKMAFKMAQQVKALIAKPEGLSLVPGSTDMRERTYSCKLSSDFNKCTVACMP